MFSRLYMLFKWSYGDVVNFATLGDGVITRTTINDINEEVRKLRSPTSSTKTDMSKRRPSSLT